MTDIEQVGDALALRRIVVEAVHAPAVIEVLPDIEMREQPGILEHVADASAMRRHMKARGGVVEHFAVERDGASEARITDLLDIGGLKDRRPGQLSGGERQRVALGRALLSKPRLLLMDEPLGSLDEGRKVEILPYLIRLRDEGIPMVYVSHDAAELRQLATQIVMLRRGQVTAFGGVKVLTGGA